MIPLWVDVAVKLTPAFFTLVVGVVGSVIAYFQFRLNRDKLRLDLFGKRFEAYEKLHEFYSEVFRAGCVRDDMLPLLVQARYKSRFVYGSDIDVFFDDLWKKAVQMRTLRTKLYGPEALPVGPARSKVCEEETALLTWMMDEMERSPKRYAPYLKFE